VEADFPSRLSRSARSIVCFFGMVAVKSFPSKIRFQSPEWLLYFAKQQQV
jgi:hypothetical protein